MNNNKMNVDQYESSVLYTVKAIAVLSVISAHCNYVNKDFSTVNRFVSGILQSLGTVGVSIFFLLAGYFFYFSRARADVFFKAKIKSLFLPWVVTGTAVYLYVTCRKGGISVAGWLSWIIGNGSYLYYMSMLTVMYLLYIKGRDNLLYLVLTILLSVLSRILTYMGLLHGINSYLNPANWMIFFSAGLMMARFNVMSALIKHCRKWVFIYAAAAMVIIGGLTR